MHGMDDDVTFVVGNEHDKFDHVRGGVRSHKGVAGWVFVWVVVELHECVFERVVDGLVADAVFACGSVDLHPSIVLRIVR